MERLLTIGELAKILGTSERWVTDNTAPKGEGIPSFKLGYRRRYRESEVDAWLQKQRAA